MVINEELSDVQCLFSDHLTLESDHGGEWRLKCFKQLCVCIPDELCECLDDIFTLSGQNMRIYTTAIVGAP